MELEAVVLDADNAKALADFYQKLLGWPIRFDNAEFSCLSRGANSIRLLFQQNSVYRKTCLAG
ncbi:MAG: hypothetical protein FWF49_03585 [Oscillospiraceae bacterium]|nr:hypothetical protein [Oscillospiraceae bacterium]